jgi:hypothetical protein
MMIDAALDAAIRSTEQLKLERFIKDDSGAAGDHGAMTWEQGVSRALFEHWRRKARDSFVSLVSPIAYLAHGSGSVVRHFVVSPI